MIPAIFYTEIIRILVFMYKLVKFIQRRRRQHTQLDTNLLFLLGLSRSLFLDYFHLMRLVWKYYFICKRKKHWSRPHHLIQIMNGYRATRTNRDVWANLKTNWNDFFWLTGETPSMLNILCAELEPLYRPHFRKKRRNSLDFRNQLLLTMIWLRQYPKMSCLVAQFGITVSCVHRIIHRMILILHAHLVPKYIKWHSMNGWRKFIGFFPQWPRVVAILDCTPFRISKPKGPVQQIYYRKDRHCHFLNWLVIVDLMGFIVLSRPGFLGRAHDHTCLLDITLPVLPNGLQIMADQGFEHNNPVIVLPRANQPQLTAVMRRTFRSRRTMIERCFGILKSTYSAAGCKRFRSRKWISPIIANLVGSLYNRRRLIFMKMRIRSGYLYE